MKRLIIIIVILAVIAILAVDGFGMLKAHRIAVEVAKASAEQAVIVHKATGGSEIRAVEVVQRIADEAGVEVLMADYHSGVEQWYQVTVRMEPKTYFLGRIPQIREHLVRESTAIAHF
jgi:hypothetical protein